MKKQYWYCIHAQGDQTQISEEDSELKDFLNKHQISKQKQLLEHAARGFVSHHGKRAMLFTCLKYNKYTNLANTQEYRFCVYGMRGEHELKRKTGYADFYMSDQNELLGTDFFDHIFGSFYLSEEEARVDSVKAYMDKKVREDGECHSSSLQINEKDRTLVCRIAERLWAAQLENAGSRLVICMNENEMQARSMELLRQVYLLLPQRIRLNMGFSTCVDFEDIKMLTEDCDFPVHVFTMKVESMEKARENQQGVNFKYPIILFDADHLDKEDYDKKRFEVLLQLSRKISAVADAKLAYAEKLVLSEKRGAHVSFENMTKTIEKVNGYSFCWWEREDLEKIEDVYSLYEDQQEMMKVEVLKEDALSTFYRKLLPWKDYARQIADMLMDESYPNRQELISFFAEELQLAKILESMQYMQTTLVERGKAHEAQSISELKRQQEQEVEDLKQRSESALNTQKQQYEASLIQKDENISKLHKERQQDEERYQTNLERIEKEWSARVRSATEASKNEIQKNQEQINKLNNQINTLKSESDQAQVKNLKRKGEELTRELNASRQTSRKVDEDSNSRSSERSKKDAQARKDLADAKKKSKIFMISTCVLGGIAVAGIAASIVFGLKTREISTLSSEKVSLESQMDEYEDKMNEYESELEEKNNTLMEMEQSQSESTGETATYDTTTEETTTEETAAYDTATTDAETQGTGM